MVVAPIELAQRDAFAWADERARGLQKKAGGVNRRHMGPVALVQLRLIADFVEVLLVIHRRAHDLARVGDRAQQPHRCERHRHSGRNLLDPCAQRVEVRDQDVMRRQRIPRHRQHVEGGRHVPHRRSLHDAERTISESAQPHECSRLLERLSLELVSKL